MRIAERWVRVQPGNQRLLLGLGIPELIDGIWVCAAHVLRDGTTIDEAVGRGVDSVQALAMAMVQLRFAVERQGALATWELEDGRLVGEIGDHGLMLPIGSAYGMQLRLELEEIVRAETVRRTTRAGAP